MPGQKDWREHHDSRSMKSVLSKLIEFGERKIRTGFAWRIELTRYGPGCVQIHLHTKGRTGFLTRMNRTSMPSAWRVSIFTGEVIGGRCDYCNTMLPAVAMSQDLYHAHRGHIPAISVWTRVVSPEE